MGMGLDCQACPLLLSYIPDPPLFLRLFHSYDTDIREDKSLPYLSQLQVKLGTGKIHPQEIVMASIRTIV